MKKTFTIRRNKDETITFRYGGYVEHLGIEGKGMLQIYEGIKYAAITAGLSLTEETLEELLRESQGLAGDKLMVPHKYHGTLTGYQTYGCRCRRCRKARRDYDRERAA